MDTFPNLEAVEDRLRQWAGTICKSEVTFRMPDRTLPAADQINFYLFDLLNSPRPRVGSKRPPSQITLRYLATATAPDPVIERRLATELLFEAIDNQDLEIESEPIPLQLWLSLGVPPRPAFIVRLSLIRQRELHELPMVKKFVLRSGPVAELEGQVLGPDEAPLMNAVIELPALKISTRSDYEGRFAFGAIPAGPPEIELVVKARGKEMTVRTAAHHSPEKLVVISFSSLEE